MSSGTSQISASGIELARIQPNAGVCDYPDMIITNPTNAAHPYRLMTAFSRVRLCELCQARWLAV
jgi:hypothetical protein